MTTRKKGEPDMGKRKASSKAPVPTKGLSRNESYALGKKLRDACPRESHAGWTAPKNRPDAVDLVLQSEKGRVPDLLPLRHGRMAKSAFTFYRGAALTMASDLAGTPVSGIRVQACGDAHLCNFGGFATPERKIIFSINDLDETLPAPWEWDVKRLAPSFVVACRDNGLSDAVAKEAVLTCVRTYRESMAEFSEMKTLELWYRTMTAEELIADLPPAFRKRIVKRIQKEQAKSRGEELFPKLAEHRGDVPVIKDLLPTIFHTEENPPGEVQKVFRDAFAVYRDTLPHSYQTLLDRYELRDAAVKVVGVGSVGTLCMVLLLTAGDGDPLFLQIKEARASVLEPYAGKSEFPNHGQRVVNGYRLMQPASDMFLGWSRGPHPRLLLPPAQGHEAEPHGRDVRPGGDAHLRGLVRQGPRPCARALRQPGRPQRVHGEERRLRQGDRVLLVRLRGPEREGPRRR